MQTLEKPLPKTSSNMSDQELVRTEQAICWKNPIYLLLAKYLSIKTKKGELIKLTLNSTQKRLHKIVLEKRRKKEPIRIWVLKFRQGGVSTYTEALIYALTSQQENRNALIMADEKEHSDNLFEISKLYQEKLEEDRPYLTPKLKKSNEKKLEWEAIHSQIIIATAENTEAARSHTYQIVHLSEVAFFKALKTVMDGLNQSVPDHWDTIIVGESTANGMNEFYDEWMRAIEGKTDWIPLFLPWFIMEEYVKPLQNGQLYPLEGIKFDSDTSVLTFEKEEKDLQHEFDLTDEQINWRRWAIVNKCAGSLIVFRQEYPATWQEAFQMSGGMFFDRKGLEKQIPVRPSRIGELFYQNMKWEFRDLPHGRIEVFEEPTLGQQYIVTADASEAVGSDEASALVLNKYTNATCAIVAGQYTPEEVAHISIALGNWYNTALIAPESKGYGYMVCQLVNQQYGNMYRRVRTKKGTDEPTEELGFNTNSVTRPQYLAQMNEEIKNNTTDLRAKKLIDQCRTFIIKKDKHGKVTKVEAQDGYQDGLVICRGIAGTVRGQYPYKPSTTAQHHTKQREMVSDRKKKRGF